MSLIEKIKNIGEKKTVLFYRDSNFEINFEGKTFFSKLVGNTHYIILNIPYNARFTFDGDFEHNSVSIQVADNGESLEEYYDTNNLILPVHAILGEPQE